MQGASTRSLTLLLFVFAAVFVTAPATALAQPLAATGAVSLAAASPPAAANPTLGNPPSIFGSKVQPGAELLGAGTGTVTKMRCNPNGISTVTFAVSDGQAMGPFPGTYSALGSYQVGPQTLAPQDNITWGLDVGQVRSFKEVFTISSPAGTAAGTIDHLDSPASEPASLWNQGDDNLGTCATFSNYTLINDIPGGNIGNAYGTFSYTRSYTDYHASSGRRQASSTTPETRRPAPTS